MSLKNFIRKTLFGGIVVLLPLIILWLIMKWAFYFVTDLIQPLSDFVISNYGFPELTADVVVVVVIFVVCFAVGTIVSTGIGKWLHGIFDQYLSKLAPGYKLIKEIVGQFFGDSESSPFSSGEVARVQLFGSQCPTTVTAIVTSKHKDGTITVFMPTGPNPTSGNIYHVPEEYVQLCPDVTVEDMMKSIIACGAGSASLFTANRQED
jgi:uncharacterized membrane protein